MNLNINLHDLHISIKRDSYFVLIYLKDVTCDVIQIESFYYIMFSTLCDSNSSCDLGLVSPYIILLIYNVAIAG